MTTIGLAMVARNGAEQIPQALYPLIDQVDQIGIVLGGKSTDNTAEVATIYADMMADYQGPLDEDGRLLDFGAARQQSFDLLNTDWAVVVDCDDIWAGTDNLRPEVEAAEENGESMILVPYLLSVSSFYQGRVMKRTAGRWNGPIHEQWQRDDPKNRIVNRPHIRQEKAGNPTPRLRQNVAIAERWLQDHPDDDHILGHLATDYRILGEFERAIEKADLYLAICNGDDNGRYTAYYNRAMCHLQQGHWRAVMTDAADMLTTKPWGTGWVMLAEAAFQIANEEQSPAMARLALDCADRALEAGAPKTTFPVSRFIATSAPYHIKAKALIGLDDKRAALAALEVGLAIKPDDGQMKQLKYQLCQELGELP